MFFSYMDTPFLPIPSPWAVRDSDTDISADCAKWCCKPRSSLDIAILVFRMLLLFLSTWIIIIGIWISQMPVSSGHTMGEVAAMLSLGCLVVSLGLIEVCCGAPVQFPVYRAFIITEASFQSVNFVASTFLVAYFGYMYGDAWFSDSMLIMVVVASNGLSALLLAALDVYILFQDKALRLQKEAENEKQSPGPNQTPA